MLVYSTLTPAVADGRWLFWVFAKEQSNCYLYFFMTFDDCVCLGESFAAELVSLCENHVLGRMPFPSTKTSNWPRREGQDLTDQCCCVPTGPSTTPRDQFPQKQHRALRVTKLFCTFHRLLWLRQQVRSGIKIGIRKMATAFQDLSKICLFWDNAH